MLAKLLLRAAKSQDAARPTSILDQLRAAPEGGLEEIVRVLLAQHPAEEVRVAMVELVKEAPLAGFPALKRVYFRHFAC